jgi:hypothetical protein
MTKKKYARTVWITFDDRIEELHAPTQDELKDLHRELLEWRNAQPEAMPPQLWDRIGKLIEWQMLPSLQWTQERKDRLRWRYVHMAIARVGWEKAFDWASDRLKRTPVAAGHRMMRTSYERYERGLPPEKRRTRTYRRNPQLR